MSDQFVDHLKAIESWPEFVRTSLASLPDDETELKRYLAEFLAWGLAELGADDV